MTQTNSIQRRALLRKFSRRYAFALAVIALLSVAGQGLVQLMLAYHIDDSTVVNVAGRQRMLSQRIVKLALLHRDRGGSEPLEELERASTLWQDSYAQLLDDESFSRYALSDEVLRRYEELGPHYRAMVEATAAFVDAARQRDRPGMDSAIDQLTLHDDAFLLEMDAVVFEYDQQTRARVRLLRTTELALLFVLLAALVLEAWFVFRPPIADLRITLARLDATVRDLERAEKQLVLSAERERERLGQEMHDSVCQHLAGLRLLAAGSPQIEKTAAEALRQARALTRGLLPATLRAHGLRAALDETAVHTATTFGVACDVTGRLDAEPDESVGLQLLRIAQEAVHNAARHAKAEGIRVRLASLDDAIELEIVDDGAGFDPKTNALPGGLGLSIMRSRARIVGGVLEVHSAPGRGTSIALKVPRAR